jgi:hypothetical protein
VSVANTRPSTSSRERRGHVGFWIDDRIIDEFAPVMGRYSFGAVALAVYAVLARRADRERDSWPSLGLIAEASGSGERTVHKALRLLELLGLIEISTCYDRESRRQTSNLYTLSTPPNRLPEIDPDPRKWPPPLRRTVLVPKSNRSEAVAATRREQRGLAGERPAGAGLVSGSDAATARTWCTLPPAPGAPPRRKPCTLPPALGAPQEENTREVNTEKEDSSDEKDSQTGAPAGSRLDGKEESSLADLPGSRPSADSGRLAVSVPPSFVIPEIGLTNRQVWAATLGELARRGDVSRTELESWLRPAALIGRDGTTLIIGAPNAVSRERIATRFLPAVREALGATIGAPVEVSVIVAERA